MPYATSINILNIFMITCLSKLHNSYVYANKVYQIRYYK